MSFFSIFFILVLVVIALAIGFNLKKVVGFFKNLKTFFGEVALEMRKVTWPTQQEVVNSTILVIVSTFIMTLVIGLADVCIAKVVHLMLF